jgi:exodeoxyribonuclease V gamma subunit
MLNDMLRGMTPDDARQAEWRRGTLPPGQLGWRKAGELREQSTLLAATALGYRKADADAYDVDIDLGNGRRVTGTVSPVFGDHMVSVTYSKLDGKHLLASWIPLLALFAQHPDRDWSAICIGRPRRGSTPLEKGLGQPQEPAVDLLRDLVAIYDAGRREPLPLPIKTSYAWACARHEGDDPERAASFKWKSGNYPGEDQDPAQVRAWGANAWLRELMQPLRPGEEVDGETHRLGAYAARLWLPMLRAEVVL